jgi:hypothetical protein
MTLLLLGALDFLNICRWFRLLGHGLLVISMGLFRSLWWGLVFLDIESRWFLPWWHGHGLLGQEMDLFGEVPCFLNIRSKQLGFLKCELGLRRGLSKSFGEISSFLEHGPMLLKHRLKNCPQAHLGWNFLNRCIEWPKPFGLGWGFLDINMCSSKSNQNHSLILIVSMAFLDRCLGFLEHMPFSTHYQVRPKLYS